ncbi:MAG: hypothetical protein Kow0020_00730 [Wenzhouxiangellaceae bacterium]
MSDRLNTRPGRVLAVLLWLVSMGVLAQSSVITYQGQLRNNGTPFTGMVNLEFRLYDALVGGNQIGSSINLFNWPVEDGLFQAEIDFGAAAFDGSDRWLEVWINGAPLTPRQQVTSAPYAIRAASTAAGAVGGNEIDPTEVQLRVSGTCPAGQSIRVINQNGTVLCEPDDIGWSLTGNAGTDPNTHFLGTTDSQPLVLRTANAQSLRIEHSAEVFNGLPISANVIAGSHANSVTPGVRGATIAGGGVLNGDSDPNFNGEAPNRVTDAYGTVSGGYGNVAGDDAGTTIDASFATVGGGRVNTASGFTSTVGGGFSNTASGEASTVGGGANNNASHSWSTVGGGLSNTASGPRSTVSGGSSNTASGLWSTVSGVFNCAGGDYSWAGGRRAKVRPGNDAGEAGSGCSGVDDTGTAGGDLGTFVWADSQNADFVSTGPNQFLVRASGGIWFGTNNSPSIPSGRFINTSTGAYLTTGGTWTNASSRALKQDFTPVDPLSILDGVMQLDLATWRYRESDETRHLGPVAEDFQTIFGLGDGQSIATVDADGVALAAIQGLNQKLEAENAALRAELAELRQSLVERDQQLVLLRQELAELRELLAPRMVQAGAQ